MGGRYKGCVDVSVENQRQLSALVDPGVLLRFDALFYVAVGD